MRILFGALALGLTASLASATQPTLEGPWYADFDEAVAAAKEADKDLFVDFTGSDWCGWCIRLHEEVFDHDAFLVPIQEHFILVALDYPSGEEAKAKVPNPERNAELAEQYAIQGYPTILLMNADGEVFAQTGYREGGPEKYMEHVREISTSGKQALADAREFLRKYEAASAEEKPALLEEAIGLFEGLDADSPAVALLAQPVRTAFRIDPDNALGLKLRAVKALMDAGLLDDEVKAAARELDPKNEEGLLEKIVWAMFMNVSSDDGARAALDGLDSMAELTFVDQEQAFNMYFMAARWCAEPLDDKERAAGYAKRALEIGSEDERALQFLEDLVE